MADFSTHYGLRDGSITGHTTNKGPTLTLPTAIISSSSQEKFEILLDAADAFTQANQHDLTYHKVPFHLLPFPDNPSERSEYIDSLRTIDTNFAECHIVRLHNINPDASPDDWDALFHLTDYRGLFPQFSAHNPSPESYNLFLHCNIGTMHINPTNIREKLAGFPPPPTSSTKPWQPSQQKPPLPRRFTAHQPPIAPSDWPPSPTNSTNLHLQTTTNHPTPIPTRSQKHPHANAPPHQTTTPIHQQRTPTTPQPQPHRPQPPPTKPTPQITPTMYLQATPTTKNPTQSTTPPQHQPKDPKDPPPHHPRHHPTPTSSPPKTTNPTPTTDPQTTSYTVFRRTTSPKTPHTSWNCSMTTSGAMTPPCSPHSQTN